MTLMSLDEVPLFANCSQTFTRFGGIALFGSAELGFVTPETPAAWILKV
eukprot:CAMPEP_0170612484 /NCGR_PEP_ID=MMETSP0224-20130122/23750_1 /TAXON_ID=285029 /ORGANISM="Togula jolla, Strain CCCM 725" /LENGTH=48 /DNA_ID= /DNA_START= /DNA_END= /DNA_ORIENTATION=